MVARVGTRNRATMEQSSLFVVVESLCDATVTLNERLDWKTLCLVHTLASQSRSSHKDA